MPEERSKLASFVRLSPAPPPRPQISQTGFPSHLDPQRETLAVLNVLSLRGMGEAISSWRKWSL